ncbi:MAG TPA: hypothetical protein VF765_29525 [Polyangiaceae bacterium]
MRALAALPFALLLAAAACGGAKKDADNPENASDDTSASGDDGGGASAAADQLPAKNDSTPASGGGGKGGGGGDDANGKKSTPCGGFEVPDLASVLSQAECEVQNPNPNAQNDLKDKLEIKVVPDSPRIAGGSTAGITVTYKNKSPKDLALDFVVDPEPRFDFEVYTLKGTRVDKPKGTEPSLPPEVANAPVPAQQVARVTLATQGTATLKLQWNAVKYKWAGKDRARGAIPGHGYPKEPAGPLPKGSYILRVITPLTGVFEGVDHEVSQPRVQVTVAPMP